MLKQDKIKKNTLKVLIGPCWKCHKTVNKCLRVFLSEFQHGSNFKLSIFEIFFCNFTFMYFIETIFWNYKLVDAEVLCLSSFVFFIMYIWICSVSCDLSAASAPVDTRRLPTSTGNGRHRTDASLGPVHVESLTAGGCRVKHRLKDTWFGPCRPVPVPRIDRKKRCIMLIKKLNF